MNKIKKFIQDGMYKTFHVLETANSSEIPTATLAGFKVLFLPLATWMDRKATPEQKKYAILRDFLTETLALAGYIGITKVLKDKATPVLSAKYYHRIAKIIEQGGKKFQWAHDAFKAGQITAEDLNILKSANSKDINKVYKRAADPMEEIQKMSEWQHLKKIDDVLTKLKDLKPSSVEPKGFAKFVKSCKDFFISPINELRTISNVKVADSTQNLFKGTKISLSHVVVCTLAITFIPMLCNALIKPIMKKMKDKAEAKKPQTAPVGIVSQIAAPVSPTQPLKSIPISYPPTSLLGNMRVGM